MKQFIFNNKPYSQTDRKSLIENYLALGCLEVPILYNGNFIDPIWNGTTFIEGATPEEISEQQIINLKQKETVGKMDDATENIILDTIDKNHCEKINSMVA